MKNPLRALAASLVLAGALVAQPTYQVSPVGAGCGPTLTAAFNPIGGGNAQLQVSLDNAWAKAHTLTYFGVQNFTFPLPGTACNLYTIPVWQLPATTDFNGQMSWGRSWNKNIIGYFILQTAVFRFDSAGQLEYLASNAVRVAHE